MGCLSPPEGPESRAPGGAYPPDREQGRARQIFSFSHTTKVLTLEV